MQACSLRFWKGKGTNIFQYGLRALFEEHFKGTKAMTGGMEALNHICCLRVKYQACLWILTGLYLKCTHQTILVFQLKWLSEGDNLIPIPRWRLE